MIDELPPNWVSTTIGEAFHITFGQSPPSSSYNEIGKGLPFFQGKAEFGEQYATIKKWCDAPTKIAEKDDVLMSIRAPVGPTNLCPERACIGRGLAAIRGLAGVSPLFILYLLRANENQIASMSTGTTFGAITSSMLTSFEIPLPPLLEQRRIVNRIEQLFTQINEGVRCLQQTQNLLEKYKIVTLQNAYQGVLTEKWRNEQEKLLQANDQFLLIKKEQEKIANVKGITFNDYDFLSNLIEEDYPSIPDSWVLIRLRDIGYWTGGGTPSKEKTEYWNKGEILWVSPKDMKSKIINETQDKITLKGVEESPAKIIDENSILFVVRSGILRSVLPIAVAGKKLTVNQDIKALTPLFFNPLYVYWYCKSKEKDILYKCSKKGTTVESIEIESLKKYPFPITSLEEQKIIVDKIELIMSLINSTFIMINELIYKKNQLTTSILNDAFTGKLVAQDIAEESANILLEKIKAEKLSNKIPRGQRRLK